MLTTEHRTLIKSSYVSLARHYPARERIRLASVAALLLVVFVVAGCETTGFGGFQITSGEGRAARLAEMGDHAAAAGVYIGLAAETAGAERDRLTLLAVEQWLEAGDAARARRALASVTRPADDNLRWLWSTETAALALFDGKPDIALDILEPMSREPLTERHRLRADALRADAWIQKGEPLSAVAIMTQREVWLRDPRRVAQNRQRLWRALLASDPRALRGSVELALDPADRGWLELAVLATTTGQQGIGWINGVDRWRGRYSDHPAITIVDDFQIGDADLMGYPQRLALLLPLSGRTATAGKAIQNGFLGAYFATAATLESDHVIRVYDVYSEGGASAAYATAVADGAEFVVGPLLKNHVVELANDILVPVPVLTLNHLPEDSLAPPGLYQFALAPEDEARAAAQRAVIDGRPNAVALVPNNDWGRRVLTHFSSELEAQGGRLLDYRSYVPGARDFSDTIEDLMGLSGSVRRYQRLRANIGGPLQFDPRRRQDVDSIFLAADASAGRLLKAQLKFHYSGDVPAYATSSIYAMDGRSNADLNGVMFADTPWVIAPHPWLEGLPDRYAQYWPEERRLARLHAMGHDAYHLIAALYAAQSGSMPDMKGATGTLYLDNDGRIRRHLAWARFQSGKPVALPDQRGRVPPVLEFGDPGVAEPLETLNEL